MGYEQGAGFAIDANIGAVPVGGIVGYLKSYTNTPSLSEEFVECNGQLLDDSDSVYDGQTIPNINGSGGGTKRFLRGSTSSGGVGGSSTHRHAINEGDLQANAQSGAYAVCGGVSGIISAPGIIGLCAGPGYWGNARIRGNTRYTSTLPNYYEVVWVMRIK